MPLTRSPIGSRSSLCEESSEMFADGRTTNVPTLSRAHAAGLRGNTTVGTSTETSGTVYRGTTRRTRAVTAAAAAAANAVNAAHVQELPPSSALNALHVAQLTDATASEKGTNSKNIGGPLENPPFVSSMPLVPTAPPRSTKSTRRVELETRLQLEKQKLEIAQAKAAITRIQLELSQCESECELENECIRSEPIRSTHVEQWLEHSATCVDQPKQTEVPQKSDIKELADAIINATKSMQPASSFAPC
ncbi:hypothetical protein K1T71_012653 [Dendrolimus kikuchii]|uniref:Uncharacterized protein n=1 Tax=Dendrolimus kikuchii TaxID=765133 RepID=A0ACC1CJX4_9NEOP|nr:hypothetical protein K1T71_012653 [Dendrolimus kikuchii]